MIILFFRLVLFIFLPLNLFLAELDLEKNFKAGDTVSAATFNEILSALEKINKIPQDSDLLGTWTCSGFKIGAQGDFGVSGWPMFLDDAEEKMNDLTSPFQYSTTSNVTLTFTSSGASTSLETPHYDYVTSASLFLYRGASVDGVPTRSRLNGKYVLNKNFITFATDFALPGILNPTHNKTGKISLLSPSRFSIVDIKTHTHSVFCDKQS